MPRTADARGVTLHASHGETLVAPSIAVLPAPGGAFPLDGAVTHVTSRDPITRQRRCVVAGFERDCGD